jgi:hypothetical protein
MLFSKDRDGHFGTCEHAEMTRPVNTITCRPHSSSAGDGETAQPSPIVSDQPALTLNISRLLLLPAVKHIVHTSEE